MTVAVGTRVLRAERGTFVLVGAVVALAQFGFFLTSAALPLYLHDLGAARWRIGFEVGLGNLAVVAVALGLGPIINRYGTRPLLILGGMLYAVASVGMLALASEIGVVACRLLQGAGNASMLPAANTLVAGLFPERRATVLGVIATINALSLAAGPPLGLTLYESHGPSVLFLLSVLAAALGIVVALPIHAPRPDTPHSGLGWDRSWIPLLLTTLLGSLYWGGIAAYLPLVLRTVHGPNAGIFFTADAVGVLLLRVPTGLLVDRAGTLLPKVLGVALTVPGILVLLLPPSAATLVAAGGFTGVGAGLLLSAVLADLAQRSSDSNRGTAMSLGSAAFSSAFFLGSTASGLLIGPGGFEAVLLFGVAATLAALPLALMGGSAREAGG